MWHSIFSLPVPVGEKVLRAILVYTFLIIAFRLAGKRELGQSNTLDLAVLLLVANAVQNGVIGLDNSVTGAVVGAATLMVANSLVSRAAFISPMFSTALEGSPTVLIEHGKLCAKSLRHENISLPELRSIARRQGFPDLGAVHTAILETNGVVSMFREDEPGTYHPDEPGGLRIGKRRRRPGR
jgi:uncharacterized membrane protein YcaP (DUF421 family)